MSHRSRHRNDSYGRTTYVIGVDSSLRHALSMVGGEQRKTKKPVSKAPRTQRLTDEQVIELRAYYDRTGKITEFVRAHPDWPWSEKHPVQTAQAIVWWINRRKRMDGSSW